MVPVQVSKRVERNAMDNIVMPHTSFSVIKNKKISSLQRSCVGSRKPLGDTPFSWKAGALQLLFRGLQARPTFVEHVSVLYSDTASAKYLFIISHLSTYQWKNH